ncbi:hypothetical protein NA57DRAFT_73599 [Rhizodiscina lignyota]|uniref:Uncharacterized protein n=1 Tax=Rhizodiscina lignyota TaxID=1504668 RepID=A0A9P4IQ35_9PEZI|nr:hypothetical protein NA57DRAFT_73599 [Rhizodiscina lignyota]
MVSRKEMLQRDSAVVPTNAGKPPIPASRLPALLRFPLLAFISLSIHTFLYEFVAPLSNYELSKVSRTLTEPWQPAAFLGFKILELAVGWYLKFDYIDLAALTILTHGPFFYFLTTFYQITWTTSATCLSVDVLALALPFQLLRPKAPAHNAAAPKSAVPNKDIINDVSIITLNIVLAAGIYAVTVYGSYSTWLPAFLASHFDGLRSFEIAHTTVLPSLIACAIPLGWSARTFLFDPSTAAQPNLGDIKKTAFNPETASLGETFVHNVWGWSFRTKVLLRRVGVLLAMQGANCWMRTFVTIDGAESAGAAGWAALWVAASAIVGIVYGWVGDV